MLKILVFWMGVSIIWSSTDDEPEDGRFLANLVSVNGVHICMAVGVYVSIPVIEAVFF